MKTYVVTVMQGEGGSTYWSKISAESAEEAVETYINFPANVAHTGTSVVQRTGGLVVVGETPFGDTFTSVAINGYGIKLFRVAPGPKPRPEPVERAHIVEQVTA